jgi:hypothetical protein
MSWLTVKIGRFIHSALVEANKGHDDSKSVAEKPVLLSNSIVEVNELNAPQVQFTVVKCANGRLVKVSEYKPTKSHHSDWQHELHIVRDDEKVPDVIARIMAIKALEQ